MAIHRFPILSGGSGNAQDDRIYLADSTGKYWIYKKQILYAEGEGNYTTFHLLNVPLPKEQKTIVVSHNLGYYEDLIGRGFVQANQSIIFNLSYFFNVTRSNEIRLLHPHGCILITDELKKVLYKELGVEVVEKEGKVLEEMLVLF